jgi:ATP-dependent exoDNAse (exonuclease V) alpha subunit
MLIKVRENTLYVADVLTLRQNAEQGVLVNGSVGKVTDFLTCREAKETHKVEVALSPRDREENPRTGEIRIADRLWGSPTKWPVVEFLSGQKRLIPPHEFTIENVNGTMQALRSQVPLILAWAISIHKSQGQTLQRVRVNLGRIFEKGQGQSFCTLRRRFALTRNLPAYVALSRATSLQTLQVLNFDPSR